MLLLVAVMATAVGFGLGLHGADIDHANAIPMVKTVLVAEILYNWSLVWSKTSLLVLYSRVFCFGYMRCAGCAVGALVVVWAVVSTVWMLLLCVPFDGSLEGLDSEPIAFRLFNSVGTIITDMMILSLPVPQIWGLHGLRAIEKASLTALFGLGLLSVSSPVTVHTRHLFLNRNSTNRWKPLTIRDTDSRFCSVVSIAAVRIHVFMNHDIADRLYSFAPNAGWTIIEVAAAVVSASFTTMGPAVIQMWQGLRSLVHLCLGRAARGEAARPWQDRDSRTLNQELGCSGMRSPQQHPDELDGYFHRLYSKEEHSSPISPVFENGQLLPSRNSAHSGVMLSTLQVTADGDRHSEEISLGDIQFPMSVRKSYTR